VKMQAVVCALIVAVFSTVTATIAHHPHHTSNGSSSVEYKVLPSECPPLVEGPILNFVNEGETLVKGTGGLYGCETILECRVQASPPDVDILWYRNNELVETTAVRDITLTQKGSTMNGERASLGLSELVHRLCVDTLPTAAGPPFRAARPVSDTFQCKVQSSCDVESPAIVAPPVALPRKTSQRRFSRSIRELVSRWHRAPVITLATSTRMELAGHFVQMMCRASGQPQPTIHWGILDEETNQEFPVTEETKPSFLWMTEKGDLLVDTSKTQLASMTFVCRAINGYGSDEQSTTLILLKEEHE